LLTTRWAMSFYISFLLEMTCFKVFPLMFIVSKEHLPTLFIVHYWISTRMKFFKKSHNIINLTPKCPFLKSLKTCIMSTISFLTSQRSGRIFSTINFWLLVGNTQSLLKRCINYIPNSLYFLFYGVQWEFQNNNLKMESHFWI